MRYLLTLRQHAPLLHSHASSSASVVRALPIRHHCVVRPAKLRRVTCRWLNCVALR